jgi:hypothetical protein
MTYDLNVSELAWAAGFFDGEGSLWYKSPVRSGARPSRGGRGQLRLCIQQNDPQVLERFHAAVQVGRVRGPVVRKDLAGKRPASPFWSYEAHRFSEVMAVLGFLWKFLSPVKREQFARCIASFRNHDLLGA